MKRHLCILILLCSVGCFGQTQRDPLTQDFVQQFKGKVKYMAEASDTNGSPDIYRTDIYHRELHLDERGHCVSSVIHLRDGKVAYDTIHYNGKGKKQWFRRKVKGAHSYSETQKYKYDASDSLIEVREVNSYYPNIINTYNSTGDPTEMRRMPKRRDGVKEPADTTKYINIYDQGLLKQLMPLHNGDTSLNVYSYDSKGRLTEFQRQRAGDYIYSREKYAYDTSGNVTDYTFYDGGGVLQVHYAWQYDTAGNRTAFTEYDPFGAVKSEIIMIYRYDAAGNWIERLYKKNGQQVGLTARQFVYY